MTNRNIHREALPAEPREPITAEQLAAGRGIRRPLSAVPNQPPAPPLPATFLASAPSSVAVTPAAIEQQPTWTATSLAEAMQASAAADRVAALPGQAARNLAQAAAWQPPPVFQGPPPVAAGPAPAPASPGFSGPDTGVSEFERLMAAGVATAAPPGPRLVDPQAPPPPQPAPQTSPPPHLGGDATVEAAVRLFAGHLLPEQQVVLGHVAAWARAQGVTLRQLHGLLNEVFG